MWDSVIVGNGSKGCSAIHVFAIKGEHSISENRVSYWINNLYLGLGMTVFKDTETGKQLTQMIENQESLDKIYMFLDDVLLQHLSRDKLKDAIGKAITDAFNKGSDSRAAEIRYALGL